eukprot:scaffold1593_cov193-Alexandrium_tamarense.AAC.39
MTGRKSSSRNDRKSSSSRRTSSHPNNRRGNSGKYIHSHKSRDPSDNELDEATPFFTSGGYEEDEFVASRYGGSRRSKSKNSSSNPRKKRSSTRRHESLGTFIGQQNSNNNSSNEEETKYVNYYSHGDDDCNRHGGGGGHQADMNRHSKDNANINGTRNGKNRFGYAGFRHKASKSTHTNSHNSKTVSTNPHSFAGMTMRNGRWFGNKINSATARHLSIASTTNNTTTGVQYRSASSTQRALEELKRKRVESQEKKRAMSILMLLVLVAGSVHYAGKGRRAYDSGMGVEGLRRGEGGSTKDKVYGDVKDLGYGGERSTAVDGQQFAINNNNGAAAATADGDGDLYTTEYQLPPPTEQLYDEVHQFLTPLRHFSDVKDPIRPSDTAYFFHVPRAGGSTIKDMIGKCLKLVQASEVGIRDGHNADPILQVLTVSESQYVNVDTTTVVGLQRAVDMGLASSGLANVVVSSYFHASAALFDLMHQGRAFILLRNPIDRAVSMYYHRLNELGDLDSSVTIEDYARGNGIENNWMTRFLTNRLTGELTKDDLEQAKEILKEKFLIGFLDDLEESMYRIMKYNAWTYSQDESQKMKEEDCIQDLAVVGSNINPSEYEIPKRGSQAYALIVWQTQFDTKLFEYARELFESQTKSWGTKERKKLQKKMKKKGG